jgi:glutamate synthase (NADPH/NADH) large chain
MNTSHTPSLYRSEFEHDSCGIGFVADLKGRKTHALIQDTLYMLRNMEHRGGCGCEPETGDGAGILIQNPHDYLKEECHKIGIKLPGYGEYGVGTIFLHQDVNIAESTRERLNKCISELGFELLGYRAVPRDNVNLGKSARENEPSCKQVFVKHKDPNVTGDELERQLFILRKYSTHAIGSMKRGGVEGNDKEFYWLSLSYKILIYKGLLRTDQLPEYFLDLQDERVVSSLALIHSRFSTNTLPQWKLAQPFRLIAHNGEINTIRGNVNWMTSKQAQFASDLFTEEEFEKLLPICDKTHSDSANLDSIIEMLVLSGRSLPHAMLMVIPEAWQHHEQMSAEKKAFYRYHANLMEPWDGPASVCFTDGKVVGAMLDRNGLRPSRFCITSDDRVVMSSEAGALPVDESKVISKGRLQPGKIFFIDIEQGKVISDEEVKNELASTKPYGQWIKDHKKSLDDLEPIKYIDKRYSSEELYPRLRSFGFSREDVSQIVIPMAADGKEALGSMGNDTPLAVLSEKSQHISNYFKQLFAQVSNPPIDPIRERLVMSLFTNLGVNGNILKDDPKLCRRIGMGHPLVNDHELQKIIANKLEGFKCGIIDATFAKDKGVEGLKVGIQKVQKEAEDLTKEGHTILVVSDRNSDSERVGIPSLIAIGAVHQHLIKKKLRSFTSLVAESGDSRETHHFATLIGYGANVVAPYNALNLISDLFQNGWLPNVESEEKAQENYKSGIGNGLLKIFSKMGISTLQSYHGSQIFEIIGLSDEVVETCFTKSTSRIGGKSFDQIAKVLLEDHQKAYKVKNTLLEDKGVYQWKNEGEHHILDPISIHLLQKACQTQDYSLFKKYSSHINDKGSKNGTIRSLLTFRDRESIPLEEVEPAANILKRFATGAMSFGSISHEAHSTLAIAMNRIGGKSNSGEGGEDEVRFFPRPDGDWERSAIKQVASGRFGVTSYYLTNADEIQIKMAQGAKPGEGGQLPGHKVDDWIARVRHSTPGVGLISPPPHHDIYSIEDLAQLIFDLKNANRQARINVKLVAEAGVGTIASGVAKAKADVVLIAGHDGGTGASPLSSIMHAGLPWELGVAEAQQTLLMNKLRSRVVLQADGQMKTGRDIVVAALLGAEEWGVATAALVAEGCIMMRKCHLNTCPVGIATQNTELRKRFTGKPEHIVNFFNFLAEEVREYMAQLGFRSIDEMVGHSEVLDIDEKTTSEKNLDLSAILAKPLIINDDLHNTTSQDHELSQVLDRKLIRIAEPAISRSEKVTAELNIINTNRATGTMLSNEISKKHRGEGLPSDTIDIKFTGSAGQSFGAFLAKGNTFKLDGEANDYVGKGLSGGKLVIKPSPKARFIPSENIIIGNVAFYGATSGQAFINGMAGERFAVRNSGSELVVEGIGDHGCEYMTGGCVVILGPTGRNFAAGMSGGISFVYDPDKKLGENTNNPLVELEMPAESDYSKIHGMLTEHYELTGSAVAASILADWTNLQVNFVKAIATEYKAVLANREHLKKAM